MQAIYLSHMGGPGGDGYLQAFPELDLYLLENKEHCGSISGRTLGDEYQRTVGAFFAIYLQPTTLLQHAKVQ